ncbi:MAG: hypothetical protein V4676_07430 [Bacteroidota bacterium]
MPQKPDDDVVLIVHLVQCQARGSYNQPDKTAVTMPAAITKTTP